MRVQIGLAQRSSTASLAITTLLVLAACSTRDAPGTDSAVALAPAPADTPAMAASNAAPTTVRGTVTAVTDTVLTVKTATGEQQVSIVAPLHVYSRATSDLAHVTPSSFVGVTSVKQPDGSERATEIHIFPEELRGTGEGSRMMKENGGGSRMTNGSVSGSRMTNGTVATSGSGTKITVQYQGGAQTIDVPAGVTVTAIAPVQTKLAVGANVVVITKAGADGRPSTSTVMLAGPSSAK